MASPLERESSEMRKRKASELTESIDSCCRLCAGVVGTLPGLRALFHPNGYRHHSWGELKDSADRGCSCCRFIVSRLRTIPKRWDESATLVLRSWRYSEEYASSEYFPLSSERSIALFMVPYNSNRLDKYVATFFLYHGRGKDDYYSIFVERRAMLTDVNTDFVHRISRQWLDHCQAKHVKCPGKKAPTLPSRVIDVRPGSDGSCVKLRVNSEACKAHYIALSYCWGGFQQVTTTKSTLKDHVTGIPYDLLSKTIQDAVTTTRNLGISYLWVDALCIIQDCAVDKAHEISKMGQIYKNATLTIAAASAKTVHEGFLQQRPRPPSCEIPIYHDHQSEYARYGGKLPFETWITGRPRPTVWLSATVKSSDADEPLYSRGWTLQERLLSPRMLLYGQKELTWQCQQNSSESIGTTFYRRSTGCKRLPIGIFVNKKLSRRERPSIAQTKQIWKSIIEDYSHRDLSFQEDRLPALAGIAEQLQGIWGTYVAGFWKNCMIAHLGWRRVERARAMQVSEPYIAPTWSWASFPGPIKVATVNRADAEILDCTLDPLSSEAPLGQLRGGYLRIRALAVESSIPRKKQEFPDFEITVDYRKQFGEKSKALYILLGFECEWARVTENQIGLVLSENRDGTYTRIGQFTTSKTLEAMPAEDEKHCERRIFTII